jgi:hypothetical protein
MTRFGEGRPGETGRETRADRAKVANALTTAYEFKEAGTRWIAELSDSDHRLHRAFELVKDKVAGPARPARSPSASKTRWRPAAYLCWPSTGDTRASGS